MAKKLILENNRQPGSPDQSERFVKAARELGCDEDEAHFEEALRKIGRRRPPAEPPHAPEKPKTPKPAK
jgi:hypothetical protein